MFTFSRVALWPAIVYGLLLALLSFVGTSFAAHDDPPTWHDPMPMQGYAWSEAVGWISLSCTNDSSCASDGGVDYGVFIDPVGEGGYSVHDVYGFAWNSNIGWIQFADGGIGNDIAAYPYGGTASNDGARIFTFNPDGEVYAAGVGRLKGWIRACAPTVNADCQDPVHAEAGDWDGWILLNCSLSGAPCPYNIRSQTARDGTFEDYSRGWGGGTTIGWIEFNVAPGVEVTYQQPCIPADELRCNADNTGYIQFNEWCHSQEVLCDTGLGEMCTDSPSVACVVSAGFSGHTLTVDKTFVRAEDTVDITWGLSVPTEASDCTLSGNNGDTFTSDGTVQTDISSPITISSTVFTLSCNPIGGGPAQELGTVEVNLLPAIIES